MKSFLVSFNIDFRENISFNELIGNIYLNKAYTTRFGSNLPNISDLRNMYKQRNQAQHGGILPNYNELINWFSILENFVNKVFDNMFSNSFQEVSLASLIINKERKQIFELYLKFFEDKQWKKSLIESSKFYVNLFDRYVNQNHYFMFDVYQKYWEDDKLSSVFEHIFQRDFFSMLDIEENEYWQIYKYATISDMKKLNENEIITEALRLHDKLLKLLLLLDSKDIEYGFDQAIHYFNDLAVPVQRFSITLKEEKKKICFYLTGLTDDFNIISEMNIAYHEQKHVKFSFDNKQYFGFAVKQQQQTSEVIVKHFVYSDAGFTSYQRYFIIMEEIKK